MLRFANIALLLLPTLLGGCLTFERQKIGTLDPIIRARDVQEGKSTLKDTLALLGPPTLILKVDDTDRAYYAAWQRAGFRFIVRIIFPLAGQSLSTDLFVLSTGSETLSLARFDFDRDGVLQSKAVGTVDLQHAGYYGAIDNSIITYFLESSSRVLRIPKEKTDEDEEEEEETGGATEPLHPKYGPGSK